MTVEVVRDALGWCSIINYGILLAWFFMIVVARGWIYRVHSKWFAISREHFETINYAMLGCFKLAIVLFNIVPYLALRIAG